MGERVIDWEKYIRWCLQWCDCEGGGFLGPLQDDEYGLCEDICDEFCEEAEWAEEADEEEWEEGD